MISQMLKGREVHGGTVPLIVLLAALLLSDVLLTGSTRAMGSLRPVDYSIKMTAAFATAMYGTWSLLGARVTPAVRASVAVYAAVVVIQFVRWCLASDFADTITLVANPSFSVLAWLFPILVAWAGGLMPEQVLPRLRQIDCRWAFVALLVSYLANVSLESGLFLPPMAVAVLFACAIDSKGSTLKQARVSVICCISSAIMFAADYRIYGLVFLFALVLFAMTREMSARRAVKYVVGCLATPLLYYGAIQVIQGEVSAVDYRFLVDTRSFLFDELFHGMSKIELMLGRGLSGTYYSLYFHELSSVASATGGDHYVRYGSEVGWMNIILKLGLVGLVPFLFIIIGAVIGARSRERAVLDDAMLRQFCIIMLFIFMAELPGAISFSYALWFLSLGLLARRRTRAPLAKSVVVPRPSVA